MFFICQNGNILPKQSSVVVQLEENLV